MTTREELYQAVRLIKKHCFEQDEIDPNSCVRDDYKCPLWSLCFGAFRVSPAGWPDPEERGSEKNE